MLQLLKFSDIQYSIARISQGIHFSSQSWRTALILNIQQANRESSVLKHFDYLNHASNGESQEAYEQHEKSLCNPSEKRRSGAGDLVSGRSSIFFPLFCALERTRRGRRKYAVRIFDGSVPRCGNGVCWGTGDGMKEGKREWRRKKVLPRWDSCRSISRIQLPSGIKKE